MQKFCKIFLGLVFTVFLGAFVVGCGDATSGDSETTLYPDRSLKFDVYPNDAAISDSVDANLAHGIEMVVHPGASYELSFDSTAGEAPNMQLFRLFWDDSYEAYLYRKVRTLKPSVAGGRVTYSFTCSENNMTRWVATLEQDGTFYQGETRNVKLVGSGDNSDHFSLNLIVVGNVDADLDSFTIDDLGDSLLASFRKYYKGMTIDTLYVNYANKHPTLGYKYPANEPWIAGYSSDDVMLSELGGWPGIENALDLVLVHYINQTGIVGYSAMYSGNMGAGTRSTVILGAYAHTKVSNVRMSLQDIVGTAVHETGHFFGLRHTTTTSADMSSAEDYSVLEDGFDDTPYCRDLQKSGLYKKDAGAEVDESESYRIRMKKQGIFIMPVAGYSTFDSDECPDADNVMFPVTSTKGYTGFSEEQLATLRANLMIFPH